MEGDWESSADTADTADTNDGADDTGDTASIEEINDQSDLIDSLSSEPFGCEDEAEFDTDIADVEPLEIIDEDIQPETEAMSLRDRAAFEVMADEFSVQEIEEVKEMITGGGMDVISAMQQVESWREIPNDEDDQKVLRR